MFADKECLNTILIGKTGTGKSSTGNNLLGQKLFLAKRGGDSVTNVCSSKTVTDYSGQYTVVDTPGLFDTMPLAKRVIEIQRSIRICPEPHAFLLIMNPGRVTPEDLCTIEMLKMIFGRAVLNHMIVVFTRGGEFETDKEFTSFWKGNAEYRRLVRDCGNRVCRIENMQPLSGHKNPVYGLVREVSDFGSIHYSYDYSKQHEEAFQHHLDTYNGNMDSIVQIQTIVRGIDRRIKSENKRREEIATKQQEELRLQVAEGQEELGNAERRLASAERKLRSTGAREREANEQLRQARREQKRTERKLDKMDDLFQEMKITNERLISAEKKIKREKKKRKSLKRELKERNESRSNEKIPSFEEALRRYRKS